MDTKTLVVGQDVYMLSGVYIHKGKVVKVTPSVVDVQVVAWPWWPESSVQVGVGQIYRFDTNGKAYDGRGTYECGPWELDDIPFAERTALLEQAARRP